MSAPDDASLPGFEVRPYREADEAQVTALWRVVFPDNPPRNEPAADIRREGSINPPSTGSGEPQGSTTSWNPTPEY